MATRVDAEDEVSRIEADPAEFRMVVACMLMQEKIDVVGLLHAAYRDPSRFAELQTAVRQHVYEHAWRNVTLRETFLHNWSPEQTPS